MPPALRQGERRPGDRSLPRVAVLGAFDRFNYGDLLFPVVLEHALRAYGCRWPLAFHATAGSDLRRCGGYRTRPLRDLVQPGALPDGSAVIVAGGEVLDARWTPTLETLLPGPVAFVVRRVRNRCGEEASDALCRWLAGTRLEFPWVLRPADFSARVRVAYNCVGGSRVGTLPAPLRDRLFEKLAGADFLSVRDGRTRDELRAGGLDERVRLAPDSAVLIALFYPPAALQEVASPAAREVARRYPDGYLCFQINKGQGQGRARVIAAELETVSRRHGLGILLLPNGRARNHEDHVALAEVGAALGPSAVLFGGEPTIHDIMFLIASARAYAGTSLHGAITALAYGVPHVGLTLNVSKLDAFLRTWDVPEQQTCVPLEALSARVETVLRVPRERLGQKRDELVRASLANFAALFTATGIEGSFGAILPPLACAGANGRPEGRVLS
ncbi:MAG TPA: polysaccharide pyruvyl transferase family protein [Gemmataceae bacterium]|nr:polysaccharide pyruvyl transferase family protein [Gemmataceae bacterium]